MAHESTALQFEPAVPGLSTRKMGIWLFLASEVMFFTGLIGTYIALRFGGAQWPIVSQVLNVPLVALNTFILIFSSVTMVKAYAAIENGDQKGCTRYLAATVVLGAIFVSIQAIEWRALLNEGTSPSTSLFGATFFTLTGFHGAHVLIGVIVMVFVLIKAVRRRYTLGNHEGIELMGLYWHFVDVVWIFLFTIIYLI